MHIAERTLFLAMSRLLWAFDFELQEDENGVRATTCADDLTEGVFVHPRHVPVKVTVRGREREELVRKEWEVVRGKLDEAGQWKKVPEGMFHKEYVPLET
jgi:hypothetical protein